MKKLAILFLSVFAVGAMSSCSKCYDCTVTEFGITQEAEICDDDQKSDLETAGYTCTEK